VIGSRLIDAPYVVIGHSVGTWLGHEFVEAAREAGLPSPRRVFFSNFPDPGIPKRERPWTPNRGARSYDLITPGIRAFIS
jgi:surfactin synthase thioesterase subunit